jgi:hypothetical protein
MIFELKINYAAGVFTGLAWSILNEWDTSRVTTGANPPASFG